MRGLGCNCGGNRLGAAPVTVTQGNPCASLYMKAFGYQTGTHAWADELAYYLCEAENKLTSWGVSAWHTIWDELAALWQWLTTETGKGITALQNAVKDFLHCIDCMDPTAPAGSTTKQNCGKCPKFGTPDWMRDLGILALLIGGGILLFELSPAINDTAHAMTHRRRQ